MNGPDDARREFQAARERIAASSAAVLRTNTSLGLAIVLTEAVDTARALTRARYGIVTTVDDAGEVREFVTSGFTPEEKRRTGRPVGGCPASLSLGPKALAPFRRDPRKRSASRRNR